jgi:hypothetical protein
MALALPLDAAGITDVDVYKSAPAIPEFGGARCRP